MGRRTAVFLVVTAVSAYHRQELKEQPRFCTNYGTKVEHSCGRDLTARSPVRIRKEQYTYSTKQIQGIPAACIFLMACEQLHVCWTVAAL